MDGITKKLIGDINLKSEIIARLLKKGDVELRKEGSSVKVIEVTKKVVVK